nr:aminoacyl-tRNA synthetase, class 1a, anticodon-binding [Tanacetum cinerariifolium]
MVELMNRRRKAIAEIKAKAKREKPMTPAQQKEFMRTFVKNQSSVIYSTGWTWKDESVPIIELFDSPPKDTSLPLDQEAKEQDAPLRKSSRKKSIAKKRTLPTEFKRYLRHASDDDEPTEPVSLALVSDITTWEIIPTEFRHGEIHVITRADGTIKRFSTMRELMYWTGRVDLMVLYGLVSDKYKTKRAIGIGLGLWMDLRTLITAREERDASIIWNHQDQWQIQSWRFYAIPAIHVLETKAGD